MNNLTGYAQCIECRCIHRGGEGHCCAEVTLQRAEVLGAALAKVSRCLFGNVPQEELELLVVANA